MNSILVTGGNGQLATCIKDLDASLLYFEFTYLNSTELDVSNLNEVSNVFNTKNFDWCINCAAYTAVDKAEADSKRAYEVNHIGAKNLALACKENDTKLIHISTDFVFDGNSSEPYSETSPTNPLGVYGMSKLKGEQEISQILDHFFIIRASWLYSEHGNNFLTTMLRLSSTRDEINVVSDQLGSPTYAKDLAEVILGVIECNSELYGIYHFSNQGVTSWQEFAKAIFKLSKSETKAIPIPSSEYPTDAKRPMYSVLNRSKIKAAFKIEIPYWEDSLRDAISNIE